MVTSEARAQMRKAFGYPFTSKKAVREAMGYAYSDEVKKYFAGLQRMGRRYFTDDVIERIFEEIEYEE